MGVPKFFRYISERYPCLSEILKEYQIPEFDNLYLDMNGIIHGCSHPNDSDVSFRITEEAIFRNVFHYVEILFQMIQPQKLFFLAIDGVAPRAKINQQRSRRFRSAKEADDQEKSARSMGKKIPEEKKFDSNCITPGTLFMSKLNDQLRYFIMKKISTDKSWQRCKVIFSGSEVAGEGEHKIMDYIRYMKSQPDYDINTRHCLYGLDADLIMLGLCTHEIHFTLLREEVKFGKKQKKIQTPEETKFCLLHLSLLREYINHEFLSLKDKVPFPYDLEKIIDDWVLMGFLIGNDFIPHLPNLHVVNGALPILYHAYIDVLPTLEGYINEAGTLRLDRFEKFMERLSRLDVEQFSEQYADLKYFESKTGRRLNGTEGHANITKEGCNEDASLQEQYDLFTSSMMTFLQEYFEDPDDEESDSETYIMEFAQHKRDYYMNKLENENVDKEFLRSQAEGYVRAIQWNLHYYYNGCCSWSWYYPHHYAPYISDIKDFKDLKLEFELGQPFKPFEQLLAVLPPLSKDLLPPAFQPLLFEEESPIINYYPNNFKTDLNGKQQEWEAIVLLPFIDAKTLIDAMKPHYGKLTVEELKRNQHGPMSVYSYTNESMGIYNAPEYFSDMISHAKVELISRDDIMVPREKLVKGLCPGVKSDVYCPRFPTLQYIPHTSSLESAKVKVFDQPSRGDNMILHITPQETPSLKNIAADLLGKTVFVNWPYMTEAVVQSIADCKTKMELIDLEKDYSESNINEEVLNDSLVTQWASQSKHITETHKVRLGISTGNISVLVYARTLTGCKYMFNDHGRLYLEKQWSESVAPFPLQTIVKDITTYCSDPELCKTVDEIFVPGSICFMLGHPYYGAKGKVLEPDGKSGRIKVVISAAPEPSLGPIKLAHARSKNLYMRANIAAQRLGISGYFLSKITGTQYVMRDSADDHRGNSKFNVGLNLKFNKKNEEAPGYTRKENGQWLYSMKAVELVRDYMAKFPKLFERLESFPLVILEKELFDEQPDELNETVAWLKEKLRDIESCPCGTDISDQQTVKKIEEEVDRFLESKTVAEKHLVMRVKPNLLFKPGLQLRTIPVEDKNQSQLFDRICCINEYFTVPLGHKGFIIGIHRSQNVFDTMYDVIFDKPFSGGLSIRGCSEGRGYRLSESHFLNISHAERLEQGRGMTTDASTESNSWRANNLASQAQACNSQSQTSAFASFRKPDRPTTTDSNTSPKKGTVKNWRKPQQIVVSPQNIPTPPSKPAAEFQALWNELHEKQKLLVPPKPSILNAMPVKEANHHIGPNACQDPSVLLKAMLKISDCNTQPSTSANNLKKPPNEVAPQAESSSNPPPLVQQLFDHARQTVKAKEERPANWHFIQIRNRYQYSGLSMPQCNYFRDGETNLVRAHIVLPDARVFVGEPCKSYEQAAESAAKKAYMELNLVNIRPDLQALIPPSQQWFHSGQVDKMYMSVRPPMLPMFSTKNQPQPPFPIWKGQHNPVYQQGMPPPNQMKPNPKFQQKYQQPKRPTNESKSEVKNSTSFVPLQAQKKSRNITPKQAGNEANQRAKDNPPSSATQQNDKTETSAKVSQSEIATTVSAQSPAQSSSQQQQKTQKVPKPKRSRVAAKFGVPPSQEGKRETYST